jgi:SHS2 domain-containing protein
MGYKFLKDVSIADVAFEAESSNLNELFGYAADALVNTMIKNTKKISKKITREFKVEADGLELLLIAFLNKLIFYKDVEQLIFSESIVQIMNENKKWTAFCFVKGEKLNSKKHEFIVDVKAATMHMLKVEQNDRGWFARVVLDI